ncbi:HD domain protein [compost metagenome]
MMMTKINSILDEIEKVDIEMYEHLERTALLSFALAKAIKLGPKEMEKAYFAGLIHDVGILESTKENINEMAFYGNMMLKFVDGFEDIAEAIKYQHNYSLLDEGKFSYLLAQIIAISNNYDELRTLKGFSHMTAKTVLNSNGFNEHLVEKFIEIVELENLI